MPEETVVAPNTTDLRRIAQYYITGATTLDGIANSLESAWTRPGSFDVAKQLEKRFNDTKTDYQKFFSDLRYGTDQLGKQLIKLADRYDNAEDINTGDAQRLAELIDSLSSRFGSISKVIPTDV